MYLDARRSGAELTLEPRGDWRVAQFPAIQAEVAALDFTGVQRLRIAAEAASFDLSSAWLLYDTLQRWRQQVPDTAFEGDPPSALALIERTLAGPVAAAAPAHHTEGVGAAAVESLGRRAVRATRRTIDALGFLGHVSDAFTTALFQWKRLHPVSIARHVYDTGVTAIPIVALIGFLISVILAYIGAEQLQKFGADIFVVDLVTIGVLRELGVLLTAIIVAGRSGSAFAAELGAMRLNEEVDALYATGVNPYEVLVVPRVIGLMIALPLLAVLADIMGIVGGGLLCRLLLDMPLVQYIHRVQESISATTFWVGIWKAPVFALLIAIAATRCGLRVRGSSRHLGAMTTLAVVQSIFMVILADAVFAILFMELDV
jgi:phospholipid/cholesterol/gamma-HCH transport system permease protein